ncbi:AAA family ATPase [Candidatus Woesearchaeota archaeon]|nr:AAA family ATPase [Candidatus Woesearchaeota archaeon]
MGLFKDILSSDETLFKNPVALDYDYIPKRIPYRESQQEQMAMCVKPLFANRNGRNLIIHGKPGIGKTLACKRVLDELEEETEDIVPLYVNCWQKNSSYKVIVELCDLLGYKFVQNKSTEELFKIIKDRVNKISAVFVFDEIDKIEDYDFLYSILEEIYRKSVFLITNHKEWISGIDLRIRSRLVPDILEFKPYNSAEMLGILKDRVEYAFYEGAFSSDAFELLSQKASEIQDVRTGLYLLRESGSIAEDRSSRKVDVCDVEKAFGKLDEFTIKGSEDLTDDTSLILDIIKENTGQKIGDLFKIYESKGGDSVYKTFHRRIKKLEAGKYITIERLSGGSQGNTSIIHYNNYKKLTDF